MFSLFEKLYFFIKGHKISSLVLLVILVAISIFSLSKVKFVEDYTKVFPFKKETRIFNEVLTSSDFLNRLIFHVSLTDTTVPNHPEKLIEFTSDFIDSASQVLVPHYLKEFYYKADNRMMDNLFNSFYDHLPLYMTGQDFNRIDSLLIHEGAIEDIIYSNLKMLMSPSGMVTNKYILKDPLHITLPKLELLKDVQVDNSLQIYNDYFFTDDSESLLFFGLPADLNNTKINTRFIADLDDLISFFKKKYSNIEISYYGSTAIAVANANRIKKDIQLTITIVLLVIIIWLTTYFKSLKSVFLILIPVLAGALGGVAILSFFSDGISALSIAIGSVILGISVDYSLHFLTHYKQTGSIQSTLKNVSEPILMSSLTTGTAFLCLIFLSSAILSDLGIFASTSVFIASLAALLILPHFMRMQKIATQSAKPSFLERLAAFPIDQNKIFVIILTLIIVLIIPFSKKVSFEGDLEKNNYLNDQLNAAERKINRSSNVAQSAVFVFSNGKDLNQALENLELSLNPIERTIRKKDIGQMYHISGLLLSESKQKTKINQWNDFWSDNRLSTIKTKLINAGLKHGFKEKAFNDFMQQIEKNYSVVEPSQLAEKYSTITSNFIIPHGDSTLVTSLIKLSDPSQKELVYETVNQFINITAFDKKFLAESLFNFLKEDFNQLVTYSLIAVFIILFIFFGRLELALVTFLPMILSYGFTLGIMGLTGIKFNIFNIIISTFIFGLGIDYSIFITKGYLNRYKTGKNDTVSFKTSILLSSVTTLMGIGVLIFAKHPALQSIALLSIIGIISVVIVSFTIQPLLIKIFLPLKEEDNRNLALTISMLFFSIISFLAFAVVSICITLIVPIIRILPLPLKKRRFILHWMICKMNHLLLKTNLHVKKEKVNFSHKLFDDPSVIIMNHQSVIDLLLVISMNPKLIILVKDWVWDSFFFGQIVRFAGYVNVSEGYDKYLPKVRKMADDGYSVMVFPEGSRSKNGKIKRFHKGAFYMARELNLPIMPVLLHGAYEILPRGTFLVSPGVATMKFLPKINLKNNEFGETYQENTKQILAYFRSEYKKLESEKIERNYYKHKLINNYIYKGPIVENYQKIKLKLDNYYHDYIRLVPENGFIYDLGCGMGALSLMLSYTDHNRLITGIDYDEDKVEIAKKCFYDRSRVAFMYDNILEYNYKSADAFIFSDVLHYLKKEQQFSLLKRCSVKLNKDGIIIIRDGNSNLKEKHNRTKLTEFLSTNIGFNKTENKLEFINDNDLRKFAEENSLKFEYIYHSKHTSNQIYTLRKDNS